MKAARQTQQKYVKHRAGCDSQSSTTFTERLIAESFHFRFACGRRFIAAPHLPKLLDIPDHGPD
jgi:hypothetical protein